MTITRRRLLTTTGLSLAAAALPSRAEEAKAIADEKAVAPKPAAARTPAHTLVVIQLAGGNDGLNTVPPMADPLYKKLRPSLALASSEVLDLDGKLALHGAMSALHARLKAKNDVAILTGVHYPKSNRSHFESTAIWQTARLQPHLEPEGWLGRAIEVPHRGQAPLGPFGLTSLGGGALTPLLYAEKVQATVLSSLDAFAAQPDKKFPGDAPALLAALRATYVDGPCSFEEKVVRQVGEVALASSTRLKEAASGYQPMAPFPKSGFGDQLKLASQLIASNLGVRVVHCTLGGFDTHGNQRPQQRNLLQGLSDGICALLDDVAAHNPDDRVTVMTYSEFGRRAAENGSGGTDHGSASVMFLAGAGVQGGLHGTPPDLSTLDGGDIPCTTDFRAVYASVIRDLLGEKPEKQLVQGLAPIKLFA